MRGGEGGEIKTMADCRVWLTLSVLTSCQRFPGQQPGLHVEIAALQVLLEVNLLGFALQHLGLQCVEPLSDPLVSPQQDPALLVVGERDGEVALPSEEGDLLHLRQAELNKHNWSHLATGIGGKNYTRVKKDPISEILEFSFLKHWR